MDKLSVWYEVFKGRLCRRNVIGANIINKYFLPSRATRTFASSANNKIDVKQQQRNGLY